MPPRTSQALDVAPKYSSLPPAHPCPGLLPGPHPGVSPISTGSAPSLSLDPGAGFAGCSALTRPRPSRATEPAVLPAPRTQRLARPPTHRLLPGWAAPAGGPGQTLRVLPATLFRPDRLFECLSFASQMRSLTRPPEREWPAVPPGPWAFFPARAPPPPDIASLKPRASLPRPRAAPGTGGRVLS